MDLSGEETRVLGCLIEKELATPQHYPLTLNALVIACNQASNRAPVVSYGEAQVMEALSRLRERGLARVVHSVHNRAAKYRHVLDEVWKLERADLAVLCVLLLRGPQTIGEVRARTDRLAAFTGLAEVQDALDRLESRLDPLVAGVARRPGQKEPRYTHVLSGEHPPEPGPSPEPAPVSAGVSAARVAELVAEVSQLRAELAEVRAELGQLRQLRE